VCVRARVRACVRDAESYPDCPVLDVLFMNIWFHGSEPCIFIILLYLCYTNQMVSAVCLC